ncbi:MAG: hypothetical protein MZU84_01105 [Sphingobacterium sp.]|nr:hypothetical protein [Sphingobacterium sp.]
MEIRPDRKVSISMKNLILFARKRPGHIDGREAGSRGDGSV